MRVVSILCFPSNFLIVEYKMLNFEVSHISSIVLLLNVFNWTNLKGDLCHKMDYPRADKIVRSFFAVRIWIPRVANILFLLMQRATSSTDLQSC